MTDDVTISGRWAHAPWIVVDQCVVSGANFLVGLLLARLLGIEQFGIYTLGMLIVWFVLGLHNALVYVPMLSIGPKQPIDGQASYFGAVLCHEVGLSVATALVMVLGVPVADLIYPRGLGGALLISIAAGSVGTVLQEFMRRYFYATARPKLAVINSILCYSLQVIGIIGIYSFWSLTIPKVFLVMAAAATVAVTISSRNIEHIAFQRASVVEITGRHWHISRWLLASVIAYWASANTFYVAAGALLGPVAVGAMRAATLALAVGNIVMQGIENFAPVTLATVLRQEGPKEMWRHAVAIAAVSFGAIVFISIVVSSVPEFWFRLLFGQQYLGYESLVYAFAVLNPLVVLYQVGCAAVVTLEDSRVIFFSRLAITAAALVFAAPIIHAAGVAGAAWGIVATQAIGTALIGIHIGRHLEQHRIQARTKR